MDLEKIWLSPPHMSGEELQLVREAFDTNWVAPVGPHIDAFEKELSLFIGAKYCVALSSGTAAIHLALLVLGIKPGDEVICSTFTFSGSCNPIVYAGATPVFVDSEDKTWNIDPALIEKAIQDREKVTGARPKAMIIVHLYGMPAQMNEIIELSKKYEIPIIEDAAEGLGSSYDEKKLGGFGDLAVVSFNGNKIITTSGGGALLSDNKDWIDKARFLATQARDQAPHYEHSHIGYNYRLSNVCAAIGRGQLKVIADRVQKRRDNYRVYKELLKSMDSIRFLEEPKNAISNRWLTTLLFNDFGTRERVRVGLEKQNIESRPLWKPMHKQPVFGHFPSYVSGVSEGLFEIGLCVPSGSQLSSNQLDRICHNLLKLGY